MRPHSAPLLTGTPNRELSSRPRILSVRRRTKERAVLRISRWRSRHRSELTSERGAQRDSHNARIAGLTQDEPRVARLDRQRRDVVSVEQVACENAHLPTTREAITDARVGNVVTVDPRE